MSTSSSMRAFRGRAPLAVGLLAAAVLAAIAASHGTSLQALSAQQEQHKDVSHD